MQGVYFIRNKVNGKVYVGSTNQWVRRRTRHRYELRHDIHPNSHLQRAWNKYGEASFEFTMVEPCEANVLEARENHWLKVGQSSCGVYNLTEDVDGHRGTANPFYGRRHSSISKQKMSLAKAGKYDGEKNPNYGRTQSVDARRLMSERNHNRRLTSEDVVEIRQLGSEGLLHKEIAAKFGVARSTVTQIIGGKKRMEVLLGTGF